MMRFKASEIGYWLAKIWEIPQASYSQSLTSLQEYNQNLNFTSNV